MARRSPRRLCIQTDPRDLKPGDLIDEGRFDRLESVNVMGEMVAYTFETQPAVIASASDWPYRWDGESWTTKENMQDRDGFRFFS